MRVRTSQVRLLSLSLCLPFQTLDPPPPQPPSLSDGVPKLAKTPLTLATAIGAVVIIFIFARQGTAEGGLDTAEQGLPGMLATTVATSVAAGPSAQRLKFSVPLSETGSFRWPSKFLGCSERDATERPGMRTPSISPRDVVARYHSLGGVLSGHVVNVGAGDGCIGAARECDEANEFLGIPGVSYR